MVSGAHVACGSTCMSVSVQGAHFFVQPRALETAVHQPGARTKFYGHIGLLLLYCDLA